MARRYGVEGQMYNWIRTRSWISVRHISLFLWSHCLWVLRAFLPIYVVRNIHDRIWRRRRDRYQHCHLYLLIWPVFRISRLVWEGCFYSNFQKLCWENLRMNIFNDCWFYNTTYSNNAKKWSWSCESPHETQRQLLKWHMQWRTKRQNSQNSDRSQTKEYHHHHHHHYL